MKKSIKICLLIVAITISLSAWYGIKQLEQAEVANNKLNQLKQLFHHNSDVYAWLTVDGTKIDYPVAQHSSDDTYYLTHDLDNNKTYYGAIFTEKVNTRHFNDAVTIIYGHAMKDDTMFGSLNYFSNKKAFENYEKIHIKTPHKQYTYRIMAAYKTTNEHLYHTFQLGQREKVNEYVSKIKHIAEQNGGFYRDIPFDITNDKLLILSTCDAVNSKERFVLHAIRIGESSHE